MNIHYIKRNEFDPFEYKTYELKNNLFDEFLPPVFNKKS